MWGRVVKMLVLSELRARSCVSGAIGEDLAVGRTSQFGARPVARWPPSKPVLVKAALGEEEITLGRLGEILKGELLLRFLFAFPGTMLYNRGSL